MFTVIKWLPKRMKPILAGIISLFVLEQISLAEERFIVNKVSRKYDLIVRIEACESEKFLPNICGGAATVDIYRKGEKTPFQKLHLLHIEIDKDQLAYSPETTRTPRNLYDDEYSVIFGDFNFDGDEDLAICNGRNGGYGAPSYNVYLYNKEKAKFERNQRLSRLTEGVYLGLFFVETKKKQFVAFSKSGCCYHETEVYMVINNRPVLIEKIIEDMTGDVLKTTTRKRIKGRWITRVKKATIDETQPKG